MRLRMTATEKSSFSIRKGRGASTSDRELRGKHDRSSPGGQGVGQRCGDVPDPPSWKTTHGTKPEHGGGTAHFFRLGNA